MDDLNINIAYHNLHPYISLSLFMVASLIGSVLGLFLFFKLLAYLQKRKDSYVLFVILRHLKRPLYFLIPLLAIGIFTPILDLTGSMIVVANIIQALVIVSFTWVLFELVWAMEDVIRHECGKGIESAKTRTLKTQIRFVSRILIIVIFFVMAAVFLMTFESAKRLGLGLLTSAGIASVVIGIASQKTLGSVMAGFQVAFNRMLRIDDVVLIDGEWGQVEEITLTHVIISLLDDRRLIIPVSHFMEKPYQNWTLSAPQLMKGVELNVDYGVDLKALRHELNQILEDNPLWDKKTKSVQVISTNDKCMVVKVLVGGHNAADVDNLCAEVREKLIAYLFKHSPETFPRIRSETTAVKN